MSNLNVQEFTSVHFYKIQRTRFSWLVSPVVIIDIVAGGLGFDSRDGQIVLSVTNSSPPLPCFFRAVLLRP